MIATDYTIEGCELCLVKIIGYHSYISWTGITYKRWEVLY